MNKVLIGLLVVSIAGNVYFLTKPEKVVVEKLEPEVILKKEIETITIDNPELVDKLEKLERELAQEKQNLTRFKNEKERQELAKLDKDVSISHFSSGDVDKELAEKAMEQQQNIVKVFENEAVDEIWAYQTQDTINRIIYESGDTSLYQTQEIKCKTTTCKVTLEPFSKAEGAKMMAGMNASMSLAKSKELISHKTSFNINTDANSIDVYITKPEDK